MQIERQRRYTSIIHLFFIEWFFVFTQLPPIGFNDFLIIKGKGNTERSIPILKDLKDYIFKMIKDMPKSFNKYGYIFLGVRGKKLNPIII
ncbi:hypothetical protein CMK13_08240, partial [Candidatus Poribacteria bacterium]